MLQRVAQHERPAQNEGREEDTGAPAALVHHEEREQTTCEQ